MDPLLSYLSRPVTNFAVGRREAGPAPAALPASFRIIAHRAGAGRAPENSLAAIRRALALGVRDIEIDVRQTRDGRWVCVHDPDLNRVARVNRRVAELDAAELQRHRAGGEAIARLDEVLDAVPRGARVHLDLKGFAQPLALAAASLLETIHSRGACARVTVATLAHPMLERLRALDGKLSLGYTTLWLKLDGALARCLRRHRRSHQPLRAIEAAARLSASAILPVALQPNLPWFAREAHAAGLAVYVYTIDSARAALRVATAGADGIVTNLPERFLSPARA